jgi:hypothetical protein
MLRDEKRQILRWKCENAEDVDDDDESFPHDTTSLNIPNSKQNILLQSVRLKNTTFE